MHEYDEFSWNDGYWICTYHKDKVLCHYQDDDLEFEEDIDRKDYDALKEDGDLPMYLSYLLRQNNDGNM